MAHPCTAEHLEFDEGNEGHVTKHGISVSELMQVFAGDPLWSRNVRGHTAAWRMIGRTAGGRAVVAVVVYDEGRRSVRPVSARECEPHEVAKWLS